MARTGTKPGSLNGGGLGVGQPEAQCGILADYDTQLMLQVREGNQEAASALARRNIRRVAGYIGRLVRDRHAAEELTHDVFVHVLEDASRYRPSAKFSTWLYRIATNTALNYLKQAFIKQRRNGQPDAEGPVLVGRRGSRAGPHRAGVQGPRRVADALVPGVDWPGGAAGHCPRAGVSA